MGGLTEWIFGEKFASDFGGMDALSNFWYSTVSAPTKSGVSVNRDVALTYSAVWCATTRRVGTLAHLPKNLYRRRGRGKEIASDRPEHWILHSRPNDDMTAFDFHVLMEEWRLNAGNAYAEIQWIDDGRTGRVPYALWPIHPSRVSIVDTDDGRWLYEVKNNAGSDPSYIAPRDMIHLTSLIKTSDGRQGLGVIRSARESVGFGIATERHGAATFGDGGMPRAVVKSPEGKKLSPESKSEFRKDWRQLHGSGNENIAILDGGFDVFPLTISNEDLQFLATRQHNIEEMSRWYDLPPHMLHHLIRMTNNNIEHQGIEAVLYSFMPWIVPNEQEYLRKLIPDPIEQREYYAKWEVNALMRGDSKARSDFYQSGINAGWMLRNEAREFEDLDPVDGLDVPLVQGAMIRGDDLPDPEDSVPVDQTGAIRSAGRGLLLAFLGRMVHIEAVAARRESKSPKTFCDWLDAFYGKHATTISDGIAPILKGCEPLGVAYEPARWGQTLAEQSRKRLLDISGEATADKLHGLIDAVVTDWESSRAQSIVDSIPELN